MNLPESLILSIRRICQFVAPRLTVLWLGISLITTGAAASTIQQPVASTAASANAAATARPKAKSSAAARARARAARIRAARAKASRSAKVLAEAKTPRYRTDEAG